MSFARSPATAALLRSLASSPQAASKTCFDCLVNPASCQISSIAAASSASTFPAHGAVQTRWQSSCASSATSISSTTAWSSASSSRLPARSIPLTSNPSSISKRNFSIQAAARKKNDVPVYTYDIPNLDDLLALEARNLNPLSEDVALESFELKLYQRRYTLLTDRVHKSFSKLQMLHLAKLAGVEKFSTSTSKAELIRLVLLAVWDLEAPVDIITRVNKKMAREKNQAEDVVASM